MNSDDDDVYAWSFCMINTTARLPLLLASETANIRSGGSWVLFPVDRGFNDRNKYTAIGPVAYRLTNNLVRGAGTTNDYTYNLRLRKIEITSSEIHSNVFQSNDITTSVNGRRSTARLNWANETWRSTYIRISWTTEYCKGMH